MNPDQVRRGGTALPRNYEEYYRRNTMFQNDYERVMLPYTDGEIQITDGEVVADISMASSAQRIPTAYLILGKRPGLVEAKVQLYHRVAPFQPRLGMEPSQWDNRVFAFCGDLVGGAITTVEVDPEMFDAAQDGEIRVATDAFMEEIFETGFF